MNSNILIIGSTGTLGCKLLNYCKSNKILIHGITCFKNTKKINIQKKKYKIKNCFSLSLEKEKYNFINYIKINNFKIIYFLDYGSQSLEFLDIILNKNTNLLLSIANKEMLIAGGNFLIKKIKATGNLLIPLDSEHFSLFRINPHNDEIKKLYITASGGPFYFKKKISLNHVNLDKVLAHPKWKMGINNSIDSSNFINKVLEIYELSIIYDIDINKIDFLVSREAFVHSVILYKDNTISLNCFINNMLLTLIKPLTLIFKTNEISLKNHEIYQINNFKLENFNDKRFKIFKYLKKLKKLNHKQQIKFMLLNNIAHKKYLNNEIKFVHIFDFIINKIEDEEKDINFKSFSDILSYIKFIKEKHA